LAKALKDADPGVRFWAGGALAQFGRQTRSALPALREAMKSPDDSDREAAFLCLRWFSDTGVAACCEALRNNDYLHDRAEYGLRISEIKTSTTASFETLLPFLWDRDPEVRYQVALSLNRICGERGLDPVLDVLSQLLRESLSPEEPGVPSTHALVESLGGFGSKAKKSVPLLCQALQLQNKGYREAAAVALGAVGPEAKDGVPLLKKALRDDSNEVRIQAAFALWKITAMPDPSLLVLNKLLKDPQHRDQAVAALAQMGPAAKPAAPSLKGFLSEIPMRLVAAQALWRIGKYKEDALKTMFEALKHADEIGNAESAIAALADVGPEAKACLPLLSPFLRSENAGVRLSAAVALCRIGGGYAEAMPILIRGLDDKSENTCREAARRLGQLGSSAKAAVPALVKALNHEDFDVYEAAVEALNAIDPDAAAEAGVSLSARSPRSPLSRQEAASLWKDLIGSDPMKAYLAQWRLTETPEETIAMFEQFLPAVKPVSRDRLDRLIEGLKSSQFRVRDRSHRDLSELGDLAENVLRKSLAEKTSLEFSRRVQKLLDDLEPYSSRRLRVIRTIQVLEFHHTPEARKLLEKLAKGLPDAWQTQEARLALERLKKRVPANVKR